MKIMVAYDGTLQAKAALKRGIEKAREQAGELLVLNVFNKGFYFDYDALPEVQSLARSEFAQQIGEISAYMREKAQDIKGSLFSAEGEPNTIAMDFAKDHDIDVLLCPPSYRRFIAKYLTALSGKRSEVPLSGLRTAELIET